MDPGIHKGMSSSLLKGFIRYYTHITYTTIRIRIELITLTKSFRNSRRKIEMNLQKTTKDRMKKYALRQLKKKIHKEKEFKTFLSIQ